MQAVKRFTESIALGLALGDRENTAWCLEGLAEVVGLHLSNPEHSRWAASLLGAADVLRTTMGAPIPPLDSSLYEQCLSVIRTQIGEVVFSQAWAAGQAMSVEQVVDYALATAPDLLASALSKRESSPIVLSPPAYAVGLTAREVEVLRLLAMGLTNQEIANQLVLSRRTVHAHLRSIYSKLDVTTRNAATRAAVELNLL